MGGSLAPALPVTGEVVGRVRLLAFLALRARHSACSASNANWARFSSTANALGRASSSSDDGGGLDDLLLLVGSRLYRSSRACGCFTLLPLLGLSGWAAGCRLGRDRSGGEVLRCWVTGWGVGGLRWDGAVCLGPSRPGRTQTLFTDSCGLAWSERWQVV